jgi:hypothetical protein
VWLGSLSSHSSFVLRSSPYYKKPKNTKKITKTPKKLKKISSFPRVQPLYSFQLIPKREGQDAGGNTAKLSYDVALRG